MTAGVKSNRCGVNSRSPSSRIHVGRCSDKVSELDLVGVAAPIPPELRELARGGLQQASESGALSLSGDLGFAILHRCGESFYFLLVSTWRNDNELWETVWAKNGDEQPAFGPWPGEGTHRPTFCVWELGAVWHEQQAWSAYLRSERDEATKQAYLQDAYAGAV